MSSSGVIPQELTTLSFERGSLTGLHLTMQVAFLAWKPQGSVCFYPTSTGSSSTHYHAQLFHMGSDEQKSLHSCPVSILSSELCPQSPGVGPYGEEHLGIYMSRAIVEKKFCMYPDPPREGDGKGMAENPRVFLCLQ